ncbi:DUF397 domain-containing protein [Actinomadura sp. NAK00032]|nr:DUF397 domain-containing protein [Actinomadura sp. NAK00032]QKW38852.1 DUF397 domain-containing protein [Actinomadura sp. NAK00032]
MPSSAAVWRKASRSHDDGDQCIEVPSTWGCVVVRDGKDPSGPKIAMSRDDFRGLTEVLKRS